MFLIDDFGRQQVSPRQPLNRWIMPLEKRIDFLNEIHVTNLSREMFRGIFNRQCELLQVPFDQHDLVYPLRDYDVRPRRELRAVHPRDILRRLVGIAGYHNIPPFLTPRFPEKACAAHFVEL